MTTPLNFYNDLAAQNEQERRSQRALQQKIAIGRIQMVLLYADAARQIFRRSTYAEDHVLIAFHENPRLQDILECYYTLWPERWLPHWAPEWVFQWATDSLRRCHSVRVNEVKEDARSSLCGMAERAMLKLVLGLLSLPTRQEWWLSRFGEMDDEYDRRRTQTGSVDRILSEAERFTNYDLNDRGEYEPVVNAHGEFYMQLLLPQRTQTCHYPPDPSRERLECETALLPCEVKTLLRLTARGISPEGKWFMDHSFV